MIAAAVHYIRLHLGDFESATSHLSALEDGVYGRMLRRYYLTEKPLPIAEAAVCRLVRATTSAERKAVKAVLDEFFVKEVDGWHQRRCDIEIARFREKSTKAKSSAAMRWEPDRNANAERTPSESPADDMPPECEGNASHKPVATNAAPSDRSPSGNSISPAVDVASGRRDEQRPKPVINHRDEQRPAPKRRATTSGPTNVADIADAVAAAMERQHAGGSS